MQRKKIPIQTGDRVTLYDKPGTVSYPIERSCPPRWFVDFDDGSRAAVCDHEIMRSLQLRDRQPPSEPKFEYFEEVEGIERQQEVDRLQAESRELRERLPLTSETDIEKLQQEVDRLQAENRELQQRLRRAKNPDPVQRPSLVRVAKLAEAALMTVKRVTGGYLLEFGHLRRLFRKLSDLWEIFVTGDFHLSDIFPPGCDAIATEEAAAIEPVKPKDNGHRRLNRGRRRLADFVETLWYRDQIEQRQALANTS